MVSVTTAGKQNYSTGISIDSTTTSFENAALNDLDIEAEQTKHLRKRRLTILAIIAVFAVAGSILIFSVVHDLTNRPEFDFVDFTCAESDIECIKSFCPHGWEWNKQEEECNKIKGYTCCVAPYKVSGEYLYHCWDKGEKNSLGCVPLSAGVAPSAYKQLCRPGYLWVQWKKKCQRLEAK